jgi:SAM-dependent methyltransferase
MVHASNADQAAFWNDQPGRNWVERQASLDTMLGEVTDRLLAAAAPEPGEAVLDVGCGAGASTFALASAVAPSGHALGLDLSAPLAARAEERRRELGLGNVGFELGDAQDHAFEPGGFDLAASRFGIMFFADPVAAFRNIATGLKPGGRMVFAAWAGPEGNPWFALPQQAAVGRLGPAPPMPPEAPGPMAFRDIERVVGLLQAAGLDRCRGEAREVDLHHPGGLEAALDLAGAIGPIPRMLRDTGGTADARAAILDRLRTDLEPFRSADGLRIPARINLFSAARP